MKYLKQVLIILLFSLAGEALRAILPLPIPAAIYGLILMLIALCTGRLKPEHIAQTADFLISAMLLLFVTPAVKILKYWDIIAPDLMPICVIILVSTALVFSVSGFVAKFLLKKKGGETDD